MPIFLQEKLICWVLCPLSRITEKMRPAVWDAAFSGSVLSIILITFAATSGLYTGRYLIKFIIGCIFLGIMILSGLSSELRPVRFSPALTVCWLGTAAFMLLSGILVETNALAGAIMWLFVLPVFYLVWSGQNFDRLVSLIIRGVLLSFLFFTVVSILFYPINSINYASFFLNRNSTGLYLAVVFTCLLNYIFSEKTSSRRTAAAILALGFTGATIYYTNCRTAIAAVAVCLLATSLLQLCSQKKHWRHVLFRQLLPVAVAIVILQPTAIYLYQGGHSLTSSIQATLEPPHVPVEPPDAAEPALEDEPAEPVPEDKPSEPPASEVLGTMQDYNASRFHYLEGSPLNYYTAGRAEMWIIHLREIALLGNPSDKVLYNFAGKVEEINAHFAAIQFSYNYGALAGILFLSINFIAGFLSIRFALKRQDLKYCLFPFAVAITFGAESIMESIGDPITDSLSLLYFLSLTPLLFTPLPTTDRTERGMEEGETLP